MCNIWGKDDSMQELTVQEIGDFFKKAKKFLWIGFTGGEPFIRNDIEDIINSINTVESKLNMRRFRNPKFLKI
jgi:molybdenum cofactor biosynthesis enzyme MoaA